MDVIPVKIENPVIQPPVIEVVEVIEEPLEIEEEHAVAEEIHKEKNVPEREVTDTSVEEIVAALNAYRAAKAAAATSGN